MAVTLQEILQTSFAAYTEAHPVPRRVWRAAPAVRHCRTAALGGHVRQCPQGHVTELWYNSCRHRACPRCCGHRINRWLDGWQQQLLPTDHFHVIFTLPSELPELWQWNRAPLTEVLFRSVRETLASLLGDPHWLGAQPGRLAALHPWGRTLTLHPHSHCLVSGGGLTGDGQWHAVRNGFLLPVAVVRRVFRGQVLGAIAALWTRGQLQGPPALGITAAEAPQLQAKLLEIARTGDARRGELDLYGQRYTIDFEMKTTVGEATIRSGWIILHGKPAPRLTTCYVLKRKR